MTSQHRHQHEPINETTGTQNRANKHLPQVGMRIKLPRLLLSLTVLSGEPTEDKRALEKSLHLQAEP